MLKYKLLQKNFMVLTLFFNFLIKSNDNSPFFETNPALATSPLQKLNILLYSCPKTKT
jgi:hypothetical protein